MIKRSCKFFCVVVAAMMICISVAMGSDTSFRYGSVVLGDDTVESFSMMASQINGVSWWDRCSAKFYFDREHFNVATESELYTLHLTLPTCTVTKCKNGALLTKAQFDKLDVRELDWTDSWCWMTYGIKLKVVIPAKDSDKTFILYDYDD